jgi:post-segregation antitoxin (ccd killing protein)
MQPTCAMRTAMSIEAAACAVAARVMGYPAFSEVILEQQLSPRAVAAMLRMSATKDGTAAAITARHAADPNGWDGETERLLALDAVHTDATGVKQAALRAAKIVAEHWQEIAAERLGSISQKNG